MKKTIALILAFLLLCTLALAEEDITQLFDDDAPALIEDVAKVVGDIPDTPEALFAREDAQELKALLKTWDAEAMVRDLWETGSHTLPAMDHTWNICCADGEELSMEISEGMLTVSMNEKKPFTYLELETGTEDRSIYLVAETDGATGKLISSMVHLSAVYDVPDFFYTLEFGTDRNELFIDTYQEKSRQNWQIFYDDDGNVKEKIYTKEDFS